MEEKVCSLTSLQASVESLGYTFWKSAFEELRYILIAPKETAHTHTYQTHAYHTNTNTHADKRSLGMLLPGAEALPWRWLQTVGGPRVRQQHVETVETTRLEREEGALATRVTSDIAYQVLNSLRDRVSASTRLQSINQSINQVQVRQSSLSLPFSPRSRRG